MIRRSSEAKNKTVFILGAGFSAPALGFGQNAILDKLGENSDRRVRRMMRFLGGVWRNISSVPLEDVYTLFDRAIARQESIGGRTTRQLMTLRERLGEAIAELHSAPTGKIDYIEAFAKSLCKIRWDHYQLLKEYEAKEKEYPDDKFSIISTNWDCLLEAALGRQMKQFKLKNSIQNIRRGMFIDFCMFEFQLKQFKAFSENRIPPSLRVRPMGFANLKMLKLHGSINWFQCARCDGVIVNLHEEPFHTPSYKSRACPTCQRNFKDYEPLKSPLKRFFVSPTFLKDFNATHLRSIWWNAGYELAEASHVVFIGYSLPLSDYDFRNLLSKNLSRDVRVTSILLSKGENDIEYERARQNFSNYFGRSVTIRKYGVEKYITSKDFRSLLDVMS